MRPAPRPLCPLSHTIGDSDKSEPIPTKCNGASRLTISAACRILLLIISSSVSVSMSSSLSNLSGLLFMSKAIRTSLIRSCTFILGLLCLRAKVELEQYQRFVFINRYYHEESRASCAVLPLRLLVCLFLLMILGMSISWKHICRPIALVIRRSSCLPAIAPTEPLGFRS